MKKLLSLILLVIILITTMPIVMAEDSTYRVGDTIRFGSYPQSQVEDTNLISTLNSLAPKWEDWTSYGYYSGKNETGSMVQNDDTRYTDISYNGCKYRGVKFIRYRAGYTDQFTSETGNQKSNGFLKNVIYWFNKMFN